MWLSPTCQCWLVTKVITNVPGTKLDNPNKSMIKLFGNKNHEGFTRNFKIN